MKYLLYFWTSIDKRKDKDMRKIIDISDDDLDKLKHLSSKDFTNPKKWIEKLVNKEVNKQFEDSKA